MPGEHRASWPSTRPSLLMQLRDAGDGQAWSVFVDTYEPLVLRYGRALGLQDADAQDVAQAVLLKVRAFEYDPAKGRFRDWLARVVRNEVHDCRQRTRRPGQGAGGVPPPHFEQLTGPAADVVWERLFHVRVLEKALGRVRPEFADDHWRAFEAVAFRVVESPDGPRVEEVRDPDYDAVAKGLGRRVGWVYQVKSRVLQRVKEEVLFLAEELGALV